MLKPGTHPQGGSPQDKPGTRPEGGSPQDKSANSKASQVKKDKAYLDADLHLRLARNRAKQEQLNQKLLLRGKDSQA
jgi:hypothetical protein